MSLLGLLARRGVATATATITTDRARRQASCAGNGVAATRPGPAVERRTTSAAEGALRPAHAAPEPRP